MSARKNLTAWRAVGIVIVSLASAVGIIALGVWLALGVLG